jgi:hypothetical protein
MNEIKHFDDFAQLTEAMNRLSDSPEKVTDILLDMPRKKYEALRPQLFRIAFPDENSVTEFINGLYIKEQIKNVPGLAHMVSEYLFAEQYKMALYRAEFMNLGELSLGQIKRRIISIIKSDANQQSKLIHGITPQRSVEIKKDFALNFGSTSKLREKYKPILNKKLPGGKTLLQYFENVDNWYKNLHGEDLGNWVKLFAFAKSVKEQRLKEPDTVDLFEEREGVYKFAIKADKRFYDFFSPPNAVKESGVKYHSTTLKNKIISWLDRNKNAIEFPVIVTLPDEKTAIFPEARKIYSFEKGLRDDGRQLLIFIIDTNILESDFKDYVSINIEEIDAIEEIWETLVSNNHDFKTFWLNGFLDIPLRFLLTLKNIYSREGNYTNGCFAGNTQRLTKENLDTQLGGLTDRIQKHLKSLNVIRTGKTSNKTKEIKILILKTVFSIAVQRRWLISDPTIQDGVYRFNINAGYFSPKSTAQRLLNS